MRKSDGFSITHSHVRETWDKRAERTLNLLAFDANTGFCVEVRLDNTGVARLRRSIQALDKKAEKIALRKKKS